MVAGGLWPGVAGRQRTALNRELEFLEGLNVVKTGGFLKSTRKVLRLRRHFKSYHMISFVIGKMLLWSLISSIKTKKMHRDTSS